MSISTTPLGDLFGFVQPKKKRRSSKPKTLAVAPPIAVVAMRDDDNDDGPDVLLPHMMAAQLAGSVSVSAIVTAILEVGDIPGPAEDAIPISESVPIEAEASEASDVSDRDDAIVIIETGTSPAMEMVATAMAPAVNFVAAGNSSGQACMAPAFLETNTSLAGIQMATLAKRLLLYDQLPPERRREMLSALNTLSKAVNKPLDMVPADPVQLRSMLEGLTPAMVGLSPKRWTNTRSLIRKFLTLFDDRFIPSRFSGRPTPAWAEILERLGSEPGPHFELGRLGRYCTRYGISPAEVSDEVMTIYLHDLTHHSLTSDPKRAARDTARYWNKAADDHPAWPQQRLTVPDNVVRRSLPWEAYPASLLVDAIAWRDWRASTDPLMERDHKPVRPATSISDMRHLRLYLGALVEAGADPATLVDLTAAMSLANVRLAMGLIWLRAGEKPSNYTAHMMALVILIARDYAKLPAPDIKVMRRFAANMQPINTGMTPKNKDALRDFEDPKTLKAFVNLPLKICADVLKAGPPTQRLAQQFQTAVAMEILLMNPLRLTNLAGLRIGHQLILRPGGVSLISVPMEQVKNFVELEAPLPASTAEMIGTYIRDYRPLLGAPGSDWLFPGQKPGCAKSHDGLRSQIMKAAAKRGGVRMNPHRFRHLMAFITLSANPAAYATVARILGQKGVGSAFRYYGGMEIKAVFRHFDALVKGLREGGGSGNGGGAMASSQHPTRHRRQEAA